MAEGKGKRKRLQRTVTLDAALLDWVEERSGAGKEFYNLSHALDMGIRRLKELEERIQHEAAAAQEIPRKLPETAGGNATTGRRRP